MMRTLTVLLFLALAAPAAAQDASIQDGSDQRALDQARAQWAAAGIHDYAFSLRVGCFCPPGDPEQSVVRDRVATTGRTMEDVFASVQREIDARPHRFSATYGDHGVPIDVDVDSYAGAVDDERAFGVEDFRVLPSRLAEAEAAWRASGIRRHSLVVTRRCPAQRPFVRRDWTVPRLHAFIARRADARATYGPHGVPRTIETAGCRYRVARFRGRR